MKKSLYQTARERGHRLETSQIDIDGYFHTGAAGLKVILNGQ
jgi:hypothetical protein